MVPRRERPVFGYPAPLMEHTRTRLRWASTAVATVCLALVCLALAVSAPSQGQAPDRSAFAGRWELVPSVENGLRTIQSAFELALRDANPLMRAIARQRLDTDAMLPRRITVALDGPTITTTLHTTAPHRFRTREDYPAQVTTEEGGDARLTQLFRSGRMEMVFDLDEGRRWTTLSISAEDRLTLSTTIDPTRLDSNVYYSLEYRRASR